MVTISVENLGKMYDISKQGYGSLRRDFSKWMAHKFGKPDPQAPISAETNQPQKFWALKDVSFNVSQGETVAILGPNGSGKSTLLKILSRITLPDTGVARINGKLTSLLEVGTGFHPDLSGRDNILLNGAILGISKREILSKFQEIHEFSGIGDFIEIPVKRYSSGMYVRLAFSVAVNFTPDIIVLDEILAVGDEEFQEKCRKKMLSLIDNGRTVLFVSHDMKLVRKICKRAVVLSKGEIIDDCSIAEGIKVMHRIQEKRAGKGKQY